MRRVTIYDSKMNELDNLFQWDANQVMNIRGIEVDPVPVIHFGNRFSREAISVPPVIVGSNVQAKIPNELLECPETIIVYMYQDTENERDRTIYEYRIPVVPRQIPSDYIYTNNLVPELVFVSDDGSVEYGRQRITDGGDGTDPVESGLFETPVKESRSEWDWQFFTEYNYEFDGWALIPFGDPVDDALSSVEEDRVLYAHFQAEEDLYAVPYPDLNYNGILDEDDSDIILRAAALVAIYAPSGLTVEEEIMADIDGDGVITAKDSAYVLDFLKLVDAGHYENTPKGWNEFMRDTFHDREFHKVEFYSGDELLVTMVNVLDGGGAVIPPSYKFDVPEGYVFIGWDPYPIGITGDVKCYAVLQSVEEPDSYIYADSDDGVVAVRYMGDNQVVKTPTVYSETTVTGVSSSCYSGNEAINTLIVSDGISEI